MSGERSSGEMIDLLAKRAAIEWQVIYEQNKGAKGWKTMSDIKSKAQGYIEELESTLYSRNISLPRSMHEALISACKEAVHSAIQERR